MKKTNKGALTFLITVIFLGAIAFSFMSCDDGSKNNGCSHNFVMTETLAPTCTETGEQILKCSICGETQGEPQTISATGHDWRNLDGVCVTCEYECPHNEWDNEKCVECGYVCTHTFTTYTSDDNATCTTKSTETAYCDKDCGATDTRTDESSAIDPTNHTGGEKDGNITPATCTTKGSKEILCNGCDEKLRDEEIDIDPTAHSFTNYTSDNNATCIADGTETAECDHGCGEIDTVIDVDSALGHNFEFISTTLPTCIEDGYDLYTCTRCYETEHRNIEDALGHDWSIWTQTVTPATISHIEIKRICDRDSFHTEIQIVSLLEYISLLPINTKDTPYTVNLNQSTSPILSQLYGDQYVYFYLDLSVSTFTNIDDFGFWGNSLITGIILPDSVTSIGRNVFAYCRNLTEINVSNGNTVYASEDGVLYNKNKTSLVAYPPGKAGDFIIPNSVTTIGYGAFFSCIFLDSVIIPDSVTIIGGLAFEGCGSLTSIIIPSSVTSIERAAFAANRELTSVEFKGDTIGISNDGFDDEAFFEFGNLRDVYTGAGGGAGIYTTSSPVRQDSIWEKQQ